MHAGLCVDGFFSGLSVVASPLPPLYLRVHRQLAVTAGLSVQWHWPTLFNSAQSHGRLLIENDTRGLYQRQSTPASELSVLHQVRLPVGTLSCSMLACMTSLLTVEQQHRVGSNENASRYFCPDSISQSPAFPHCCHWCLM